MHKKTCPILRPSLTILVALAENDRDYVTLNRGKHRLQLVQWVASHVDLALFSLASRHKCFFYFSEQHRHVLSYLVRLQHQNHTHRMAAIMLINCIHYVMYSLLRMRIRTSLGAWFNL